MSSTKSLAIAFRLRVLNLWFSHNRWSSTGNSAAKSTPPNESDMERWFGSSKEFDEQIRQNFQDDLPRLMNDEYRYPDDLTAHPEQLLACIIALDQFPRNIYRNNAQAYAYDNKAKELSQLLITSQTDKQLPYVERSFVYLPFEHSENLDDQNAGVSYFQQLYEDAKHDPTSKEDILNFLKLSLKFSEQHRDIVKQFGRFPHRNAVLKRQALESEEIYLRDGGERFGQ